MSSYAIIELADGYEVVEVLASQSPEDAAAVVGGQLVDAGPYDSYDKAVDALDQLDIFDEHEQQ